MKPGKPVAITGMGCICAAGADLEACMTSLFTGKPKPESPRRFTADHPNPYPVFELSESVLFNLYRDQNLSLTAVLGITAARQALENAGWKPEALRRIRTGVCIGTTVGCTMNDEGFYRIYRSGKPPNLTPIRRFLNSNPAASIAKAFGMEGPCQTLVNACCSGTDAIGIGASWIRQGLCDVVLAGGTDELSRVTYNGFISLMITDTGPCRPFDRDRKGLNLGEGAAVMVLESDRSCHLRKKTARAFVMGYGSAADAYHLTAPKPDGAGLKKAITDALSSGGKTISEVACVGAHGTGTQDNDRVEARVLHELMPGVPFFSTKGHTGHTLGAAGAIQAVLVAAFLGAGRIPASAGFHTPDPELPIAPTINSQTISGEIALSESLAFGGSNAALLLGIGDN